MRIRCPVHLKRNPTVSVCSHEAKALDEMHFARHKWHGPDNSCEARHQLGQGNCKGDKLYNTILARAHD